MRARTEEGCATIARVPRATILSRVRNQDITCSHDYARQ